MNEMTEAEYTKGIQDDSWNDDAMNVVNPMPDMGMEEGPLVQTGQPDAVQSNIITEPIEDAVATISLANNTGPEESVAKLVETMQGLFSMDKLEGDGTLTPKDAITLATNMYKNPDMVPTSEGVPLEQRVELQAMANKTQKSQDKLKHKVAVHSAVSNNFTKIPEGEFKDNLISAFNSGEPVEGIVRDVQSRLGVTVDGMFGDETLKAISRGKISKHRDFSKDEAILEGQELADKTYHGKSAIKKVESMEGPLNAIEKRVLELEAYVDGTYLDDTGVVTSGAGQTQGWRGKSFKASVKAHADKTKEILPKLPKLPEKVQAELVQLTYRGDVKASHNWVRLFNAGEYKEAAKQFRVHDEWQKRKAIGEDSVTKRLEAAARAISSLDKKA